VSAGGGAGSEATDGGSGDEGALQGGNNQAITMIDTIPPRGLCLREALSLLIRHKSSTLPASKDSTAPMLRDNEVKDFYIWAFELPDDWLDVSERNWKVPNWWINTPLPAIARLYKKTLTALRQARGHDGAKTCIREFMEKAGSGPNIILSESKGILSQDACSSLDLVSLADAIDAYAIQYRSNVPGPFSNIHHVDAQLHIRMECGRESAPRYMTSFQARSRGGDGPGASPRIAAAAEAIGEL